MIATLQPDKARLEHSSDVGAQQERQSDPSALDLSIYLHGLRSVPLLTPSEEIQLAQRIEAARAARDALLTAENATARDELGATIRIGDAAFSRLVESNLRLVVSVARRYTGRGVDLEDLIQEGSLGLYRAAGKYDWRHGTRFSTYATWWIRQAVQRSLANSARLIRLPVHVVEQVAHAQHALQQLEQGLGRAPTPAEQADRLDPGARRAVARAAMLERLISIDGHVTEDLTLAEVLPDRSAEETEETVEHRLTADSIDDAITDTLKPREAQVLRMRFGLGGCRESSLVDIGATLGMSRERARQIEVMALRKLRRSSAIQRQFGVSAS